MLRELLLCIVHSSSRLSKRWTTRRRSRITVHLASCSSQAFIEFASTIAGLDRGFSTREVSTGLEILTRGTLHWVGKEMTARVLSSVEGER